MNAALAAEAATVVAVDGMQVFVTGMIFAGEPSEEAAREALRLGREAKIIILPPRVP